MRVTGEPLVIASVQSVPHEMPVAVTVPEPVPWRVTVRLYVVGGGEDVSPSTVVMVEKPVTVKMRVPPVYEVTVQVVQG